MSARAPTLDPPNSPRGERRRHVLRPRPVLVFACIAAATCFVYDARPADHMIEAKFRFTGVPASYVVPAGICRVRIEAVGAAGGGEGIAGGSLGVGGSGAAGGVSGGGGGGFFGGGGGGSEFEWVSRYFGGGHGGGGSSFGPSGTTFSGGIGAGFGWATISYNRENDACRTTPRKGDPAAAAHRERGYTTLQRGEKPEQWNSGSRDHTADAAHPVPAKPSPAAVTAFYRRAAERTARLMGKPAPKWKVCPNCKLAFHGPDTVPENPATGHAPGDWQP